MNAEIDLDTLLEAYAGLKVFGQAATEDTCEKLKKAIIRAGGKVCKEREDFEARGGDIY